MDFVIGLIVGLIVGAFVGMFVAALASISRESELMEKMKPDPCDIVLDETIATLKKQSRKEKDSDTWESDMNRDAEKYKAGE